MLREDVSLLLKTGRSKVGEWFHKGQRIPGQNIEGPLPPSLCDASALAPLFPNIDKEVDLTDGCAAQFDGKNNYHKVVEWPSKVSLRPNQPTNN